MYVFILLVIAVHISSFIRSFECLNHVIFGVKIHFQNIYVTFKFQGHWVNIKVMTAKKQLHEVCVPLGHSLICVFLVFQVLLHIYFVCVILIVSLSAEERLVCEVTRVMC